MKASDLHLFFFFFFFFFFFLKVEKGANKSSQRKLFSLKRNRHNFKSDQIRSLVVSALYETRRKKRASRPTVQAGSASHLPLPLPLSPENQTRPSRNTTQRETQREGARVLLFTFSFFFFFSFSSHRRFGLSVQFPPNYLCTFRRIFLSFPLSFLCLTGSFIVSISSSFLLRIVTWSFFEN